MPAEREFFKPKTGPEKRRKPAAFRPSGNGVFAEACELLFPCEGVGDNAVEILGSRAPGQGRLNAFALQQRGRIAWTAARNLDREIAPARTPYRVDDLDD